MSDYLAPPTCDLSDARRYAARRHAIQDLVHAEDRLEAVGAPPATLEAIRAAAEAILRWRPGAE